MATAKQQSGTGSGARVCDGTSSLSATISVVCQICWVVYEGKERQTSACQSLNRLDGPERPTESAHDSKKMKWSMWPIAPVLLQMRFQHVRKG